jgi:tetratricopeptide (TPR) repeat protein
MMRAFHLLMAIGYLLAAGPGLAEQRWVEGWVLIIDDDGRVQPPPQAATVRVYGLDASSTTELSQGTFRLQLPEGAPISLDIELKGYSVCVPPEAPAGAAAIRIAALLTATDSEAQAACGRRMAAGIAGQVNWFWPTGISPRKLEPVYFVKGWARQHGLDAGLVGKALEQWRQEGAKPKLAWDQALAAFVAGDHEAALRYADSAVRVAEQQPQKSKARAEAAQALNLMGVVYNANIEPARALKAYERASQYASQQEDRHRWASVEYGTAHAHAYAALSSSREKAREHLESAAQHYRQVLMAHTREESPLVWATLQANIATTLLRQSRLPEGAAAQDLTKRAEQLYREALATYPYEQTPDQWTVVHARLGYALSTLGQADQALAAFRTALQPCMLETPTLECRLVQSEYASFLKSLGKRLEGAVGVERLRESVAAYRVALQLCRQEKDLRAQSSTQSELGNALAELGTRVSVQESLQLLTEAAEQYREVLSLYRQVGTPEDSAAVRLRLAGALTWLVQKFMGGGESPRLLKEALEAVQESLVVYTFERHPSQWAEAQVQLGHVLMKKSGLVLKEGGGMREAEAIELMEQAIKAFERSLRVYTPEKAPKQKARVQALICTMRRTHLNFVWHTDQGARVQEEVARACGTQKESSPPQGETSPDMSLPEIMSSVARAGMMVDGEEKRRLLTELIGKCDEALRTLTADREPQTWVAVKAARARALLMQIESVESKDEKIRISGHAESAFRELLQVYAREQSPQPWAAITSGLASALAERGRWLEGDAGVRSLEEAVRLHWGTLAVYNRNSDPVAWASAQDNLCYALKWLGARLEGEPGAQRVRAAIEACNQALTVFKPELYPEHWGQTKRNLDHARRTLLERGEQRQESLPPTAQPPPQIPPAPEASPGHARLEERGPAGERNAWQSKRWLSGQIFIIDIEGNKRAPPQSATVRLRHFKKDETTTSPGDSRFKLPLPETVTAGDRVSLEVMLDGYEVISPSRGEALVHEDETGKSVQVLLRPTGSKFIREAVDAIQLTEWYTKEIKLQLLYSQRPGVKMGPPKSIGSSWTLEAEAKRLGVSTEEIEAEFRKQLLLAEFTSGAGARQLLDAFAKGDYQAALGHAEGLTRHWERQLGQAERQGAFREVKRARNELAWTLSLKGLIYCELRDFPMSKASYRRALEHARREDNAYWWAMSNGDLGTILALEGSLSEKASSMQSLHDAMRHLMLAAEVFARERTPREWASNQGMLGFVLFHTGMRETGPQARQHLEESVAAYEQALEVLDAERMSLEWAETQNWYAQALTQLGQRQGGERRRQVLARAEKITEQVLQIFTRARFPLQNALTCAYLGSILFSQAMEAADRNTQIQKLAQAQAMLEQSFRLLSHEEDPHTWASLRLELSGILSMLGRIEQGERALRRMNQAIEMSREVLEVITPEGEPRLWAKGNLNLGMTLLARLTLQAGSTREEELVKVAEQAQHAFSQVLTVSSRGWLSQEWAAAHMGLCLTLQELGNVHPGQEGLRLLEQAVGSCRTGAEVFTREYEPQMWAALQLGQAKALSALGARLGGEEEMRLLEDAMSAYSHLLQSARHVSAHIKTAEVHSGLSVSLARLESFYRESLAGNPGDTMAQGLLAENLLLQGRYKESAAMLTSLSGNSQLTPHTSVRVKVLALIARSATGEQGSFVQELEELCALVASQGDEFEAGGATDALAYLVEADTKLTAQRRWLGSLLQVLQARGRDGMLQALSDCRRMDQTVQGEP